MAGDGAAAAAAARLHPAHAADAERVDEAKAQLATLISHEVELGWRSVNSTLACRQAG